MGSYDDNTINSVNPLARFAHRTRVKKSIRYAKAMIENGKILDYGCGSGVFIQNINEIKQNIAYGYEPFMDERKGDGLPIYKDFDSLKQYKPYSTITLFETIEHLSDEELQTFLSRSDEILSKNGTILISGPIEIGPVLFLKEFNRVVINKSNSRYHIGEFFKAALCAIPGRRAENIKTSHRGFDFRKALKRIEDLGWEVTIAGYSPIKILSWYGNSQFFAFCSRRATQAEK